MHRARRSIVLLILGSATLCLFACPGGDDDGKGGVEPLTARTSVAQVSLAGSAFEVRMPGEVEYKPWTKEHGLYLPRGATVRSGDGSINLNFMQCMTIDLRPKSVLILQGAVNGPRGREFVLGLQEGGVWVQFAAADHPLVIKMPHGEARGRHGMIKIEDLRWDPKGGYRAFVKAHSRNITVSNDRGSLVLPNFGDVRLVEAEPPSLLKERAPGGRPLPRRPGK